MKTVRKLAGKKGATDDEQEDLEEALQLAALEASAVADAATLSSGGSSPRRQQWLEDQKDYSIRMNCVISPFMAQIAAEHADDLDGVQSFTVQRSNRGASTKPRPKSLDPKESHRLHKEFAKEEKERRRRSAKLNSSKVKRESAFVYLPSLHAGSSSPAPFITERLSTNPGSAAQELFQGRTMRQNAPSPTTAPLQPLSTMRPRSMCIRELALTSASLAQPTTGDTSQPPASDDGISPPPVLDDSITPPPMPAGDGISSPPVIDDGVAPPLPPRE